MRKIERENAHTKSIIFLIFIYKKIETDAITVPVVYVGRDSSIPQHLQQMFDTHYRLTYLCSTFSLNSAMSSSHNPVPLTFSEQSRPNSRNAEKKASSTACFRNS